MFRRKMTKATLFRISVVALLAGTMLSACGKRGALDAPPGLEPAPQPTAAPGAPGAAASRPKRTPITPPKRDLFIDRLLD
jgi:predicted small lipoprotein YifL